MTGGNQNVAASEQGLIESTSTEIPFDNKTFEEMIGGKAKGKGKKAKAQEAGTNPGFQAFLDLKKYIAGKLGISNGPQAAKVAGAVQKDMKEKHPELDAVKIAEAGRKHFDANMEHYKQMLPK